MKYFIRKFKKIVHLRENRQLEKKRVAFYRQFISCDDLVFDVGANTGNRVKVFLQLGAKVVAVEPQKECCATLKRKFGDRIFIIPKGAGANEDKKPFYVANVSVLSTFSEEFIVSTQKSGRFEKYNWKRTNLIDITTLDLIIKKYGVPHFIKIDVEGYELEVLKGLSHSINYISFKYIAPEQIEKAIECIKRIDCIIGNKVLFNYSKGESLELAMNEWLSTEKMINFIISQDFENAGFGDIYARKLN